ncbi:FeoA family protein [uncultured Faecalicoccus sp.]|uniref:FeoA family protein n=1 Tax=uncultured Faecalicoccus sp. TaxID=1971760 RepID=UPI0026063B0B|nr:FeoA family protein [uncultured Faecalicoccus sp.]
MPLTFAQLNQEYVIVRITGQDKVRAHLRNLGFVENEKVSVIQSIQGNLIVSIKGVRVALDKSLANRIMI